MVLKGVRDKNQQKSEIRKYAILSQPRNVTSFEDEIFQLFSYLYGSKVPKWNFAHILLWKKAKNIRKTPKNTLFTVPWLRTTLLNDTVYTNVRVDSRACVLISGYLCRYFHLYVSICHLQVPAPAHTSPRQNFWLTGENYDQTASEAAFVNIGEGHLNMGRDSWVMLSSVYRVDISIFWMYI